MFTFNASDSESQPKSLGKTIARHSHVKVGRGKGLQTDIFNKRIKVRLVSKTLVLFISVCISSMTRLNPIWKINMSFPVKSNYTNHW